ncbi:MAG: MATE family efflux transporter [Flavobacteriaceae bacterium]|nr:MATE family efflux transporter [Flavobacteriaceae bacterium]
MALSAYTKEFQYNFKLAFPIMLGQLGHVMVGLVDNLMVGQLGAAELAAISLGNSLIFIALSIGIGFSFAITPLIAEADGESNIENGRNFFHHGMILCGINGLLLFILLLFIKPILYHLNQPPEVVDLAIPYLEIVAFSMIPLMLFQGFKQFADGLSQTKYAMYATLIANVVNIIFNYLLIYGIWIFPRLELEGAALGTLISRFFMLAFIYYILKNNKKFSPYFIWSKRKNLNMNIFKRLFGLGFPTALQMFFEVALFTASIFLAGMLGTNSQAANQIALNLASMTFMIAVGFSVTATIRVGNQKGKKNFTELRRIAFSIFLMVLVIQAFFAILFIITKGILPTFYIDNAEVIQIASTLLIVAAIFQLSDGLQVVFLGALRGLQDVNIPSWICFVAYWLVGFPVGYFLGKGEAMGAMGIWIGLFAGLTVSALMLYLRFDHLTKKLIKGQAV